MVVRALLLSLSLILSSVIVVAAPNTGTTIQCSDSFIQGNLDKVKTSAREPRKSLQRLPSLPIEVYGAILSLSQSNFGHLVVDIEEEKISLGPTYSTGSINVNSGYYDFLEKHTKSPRMILNFVLAHELAHHVDRLYSLNVKSKTTIGGYVWDDLEKTFNREVYPHAHVDCLALSLMKNTGMQFNQEIITEGLATIRDECVEYRGKKFCDEAHEVRVAHIKSWFQSLANR